MQLTCLDTWPLSLWALERQPLDSIVEVGRTFHHLPGLRVKAGSTFQNLDEVSCLFWVTNLCHPSGHPSPVYSSTGRLLGTTPGTSPRLGGGRDADSSNHQNAFFWRLTHGQSLSSTALLNVLDPKGKHEASKWHAQHSKTVVGFNSLVSLNLVGCVLLMMEPLKSF